MGVDLNPVSENIKKVICCKVSEYLPLVFGKEYSIMEYDKTTYYVNVHNSIPVCWWLIPKSFFWEISN